MRKQCKRKVWKLINPLDYVLQGVAPTPESLLDDLRARELSAIAAFSTGQARLQEWHELCAMMNLTELLAKDGVGPEALEVCREVEQHLIDAANRYERTQKIGMTGPGIVALRNLYEFHDLQRQSISRGEYEKAIQKMKRRVKSRAPEVIEIS